MDFCLEGVDFHSQGVYINTYIYIYIYIYMSGYISREVPSQFCAVLCPKTAFFGRKTARKT